MLALGQRPLNTAEQAPKCPHKTNYNRWQFANHLTTNFPSKSIAVCNLISDVSSEIRLDNDGSMLPSDEFFPSFLPSLCLFVRLSAIRL